MRLLHDRGAMSARQGCKLRSSELSHLARGPPISVREAAHVENTEIPRIWGKPGRSGEGLEDRGVNKPIMTHLTAKYRSGCFNACPSLLIH
jgi:hypothetical protein